MGAQTSSAICQIMHITLIYTILMTQASRDEIFGRKQPSCRPSLSTWEFVSKEYDKIIFKIPTGILMCRDGPKIRVVTVQNSNTYENIMQKPKLKSV